MPLQIVLLLLATSETATTGGLEAVFKQSSFMGIPMDPKIVLALSVSWSLRTCMALHLKSVATEKGFIKITSKFFVFLWGAFAVMRRVLAIVAYYIPCLGLFSILYLWEAEKIPYKIRLKYANGVSPADEVKLFGLNETILWSDLDRWDYSNPDKPSHPPYSVYTGLSVQDTFIGFFILMALQFLALGLVKFLTSEEFRSKADYFDKFVHLVHCLNMAFPYRDWDHGVHDIEEYKRRYQNTVREMRWSSLVNITISFIMMLPFWYTGKNITFKL